MVQHWYRQRIVSNEETGQTIECFTKLSDAFDDELYPTLFFEHFNEVPIYNTFTLIFTDKLVLGETPKGQDKEEKE